MNVADTDVERYLKILTLLNLEEISDIMEKQNKNPELRI
jgi:tyrosyl-tRNA synthetase